MSHIFTEKLTIFADLSLKLRQFTHMVHLFLVLFHTEECWQQTENATLAVWIIHSLKENSI